MSSLFTLTAPQKLTLGVLGAVFLGLSTGNATQAAVLFNNNAPDLQNAVRSDFSFPVEAGDDFRFTTSNDIRSITWSGTYATNSEFPLPANAPAADNFSIRIFSFIQDPRGLETPAINPLLAFNPSAINRNISGTQIQSQGNRYDVYNYAFNLATPSTLGAGNYFLSIVNNTSAPGINWFWATSSQNGDGFGRERPGDDWFRDGNNVGLSFTIRDDTTPAPPTSQPAPVPPEAVPTPALLPGLIAFGLSVWRKRRSTDTVRSTEAN
ncbi:MAG: PTPA-CTERM sorting domain-containing protein [Tildeniella nuda ZEHNDER 1965/U140]|jgi:hypothetical protein|nr:PTPA-CTERM sorting domain-containing protein [Tildeniella nuda ZEHNDER 1965/U140]